MDSFRPYICDPFWDWDLMSFYLDDKFELEYPKMVSEIRSEEYYVKMMIAWYFATALAKQYDVVLPFIENRCLEKWTHNKAIKRR